MNDIIVKLIINVELTSLDVIARIEDICTELSLTPEEFISNAINKLKYLRTRYKLHINLYLVLLN